MAKEISTLSPMIIRCSLAGADLSLILLFIRNTVDSMEKFQSCSVATTVEWSIADKQPAEKKQSLWACLYNCNLTFLAQPKPSSRLSSTTKDLSPLQRPELK